jgi:hypothetical protein
MVTPSTDPLDPKFITLMANHAGNAIWVGEICNHDTGNKKIQYMIHLWDDGVISFATRPTSDSTWSPSTKPERRD